MLKTFEMGARDSAKAAVLWMHGLGAGPRDFESVVPLLRAPHVRFVFPAAPVRPVTINGGFPMPAWYDILSLADPPLREDARHVRESEAELAELIEREHQRGVPHERIALVGFSQGGAMALHTAVRYPHRLAGAAVLSGYLLLPDDFERERTPENAQTPFLLCHGTEDPMVPLELGRAAYAHLVDAGYPATLRTYPMPHSLCVEEVEDLRVFLAETLAL